MTIRLNGVTSGGQIHFRQDTFIKGKPVQAGHPIGEGYYATLNGRSVIVRSFEAYMSKAEQARLSHDRSR